MHPAPRDAARLSTVAAVSLGAMGVAALVLGAALYNARGLAFPVLVQAAVLAAAIPLGMLPCLILLRATRLASQHDNAEARRTSIRGGLMVLAEIGAAALFRTLANPCWNNASCTRGASLEDGVLNFGLLISILAAAVALLVSPVLLILAGRANSL